MRSTRPVSKYDSDEMEMYTDGYLEFVLEAIEEARQDCPDPKVLIEQRLDFSCYVPDGFGTGDCLIVADKLLHIIDLKYGQGVLVNAEENPQMMLYALGALRIFDCLYDIETVSMTIYQPRRENVSTWVISVAELRDWAEKTLKPKAKKLHHRRCFLRRKLPAHPGGLLHGEPHAAYHGASRYHAVIPLLRKPGRQHGRLLCG